MAFNVTQLLSMFRELDEAGQSIRVASGIERTAEAAKGMTPALEEVTQLTRAGKAAGAEGATRQNHVATAMDQQLLPDLQLHSSETPAAKRADHDAMATFKELGIEDTYGLQLNEFFTGLRIRSVFNLEQYGKEVEEMDRTALLLPPEERALHFPPVIVKHLDERTPPRFETKATPRLAIFSARIEGDLQTLLRAKPDSELEERAGDVAKILSKRTFEFFNEHMDAIDVEKSRRVSALRGALAEMKPDPDFHKKFYFTDSNYLIDEERQKFDLKNPDLADDGRDQEHDRIGQQWYGQYRQLEDASNELRTVRDAQREVDDMRRGLDSGAKPPEFDVKPYGLKPLLAVIRQDEEAFKAAHPDLSPARLHLELEDLRYTRMSQHRANKYGDIFGTMETTPETAARRNMLALRYGLVTKELPPGFNLNDFSARDVKAVIDADKHGLEWTPKVMWKEGKDRWPAIFDYAAQRRLEQWRTLQSSNGTMVTDATAVSDAVSTHR